MIGALRIARVTFALACALGGCGYKPGSFVHTQGGFVGERASVGCFDIAIDRRPDLPIGPVLDYQFANRCDHPATIDLVSVAVVGRNADGADVALRPYDPHAELHPVPLDGRTAGAEQLAYPAQGAMAQICVDVATLAGAPQPQWLCLGQATGHVVGSVP